VRRRKQIAVEPESFFVIMLTKISVQIQQKELFNIFHRKLFIFLSHSTQKLSLASMTVEQSKVLPE